MVWQASKVVIAGIVISFTSWLAGKQPRIAGFLLALPLSSMLALIFFQAEFRDTEKASTFAKSIFLAVPLSLLFFVPFLFAGKLGWSFWTLFLAGTSLLVIGYLFHALVLR